MKTRHKVQTGRRVGEISTTRSFHAESSPNSSVIFAVTVSADTEDVLAVVRTAALIGKQFKVSVSVDLPEKDVVHVAPQDNSSQASLEKLLRDIRAKLCERGTVHSQVFAVEVNFTVASFFAAGTILVRVCGAESEPKRPAVAR